MESTKPLNSRQRYYYKNKDKELQYHQQWYGNNAERIRKQALDYYTANRGLINEKRRAKRLAKKQAVI